MVRTKKCLALLHGFENHALLLTGKTSWIWKQSTSNVNNKMRYFLFYKQILLLTFYFATVELIILPLGLVVIIGCSLI